MQRIVQAVVRPAGVAHHQQLHRLVGLVDEGMGDAIPRLEAHPVTWLETMGVAVDPGGGMTGDHIDEFVFGGLGMGPRGAATGWQPFVVDAQAGEAEVAAEGGAQGKALVTVGIAGAVGGLELGPVNDLVEIFPGLHGVLHLAGK